MKEKWNIWLPVILMVLLACTLWPGVMPYNFSAAYALAFCAGIYFPGKLRWILPLSTLLISDMVLNYFYYAVSPFHPYVLIKLVTFSALIFLGTRFTPRSSFPKLLSGGIAGALLFYLLTNTASWLYDPAYPKTFMGWVQALTTGRPEFPHTWEFFRNTLLSGGLFTGLFVGSMKLSEAAEESKEREESENEEGAGEQEEAKA
ncbi:MAG: DUF6580 family putative transport protein [Verrucomicrobiota bacterium]|nr:DUF6580 family putative transport protein [Verrucomicrobiota bacterium]